MTRPDAPRRWPVAVAAAFHVASLTALVAVIWVTGTTQPLALWVSSIATSATLAVWRDADSRRLAACHALAEREANG